MNEKEDYFRFCKKDQTHILSDRIPLKMEEIGAIPMSTFLIAILFFGKALIAIVISLLTTLGYTMYRFGAWIYYSEIQIDEKSGKMIRLKKILNHTRKVDLITDRFNPDQFKFLALNRSGKNKFLLTYKTYKNHDLLIVKNVTDKNLIENYIKNEVKYE